MPSGFGRFRAPFILPFDNLCRLAILQTMTMTALTTVRNLSLAPAAVVHCRCCGASYDARSWAELPYVGMWSDDVESFESRNCPCTSTLSVEVAQ